MRNAGAKSLVLNDSMGHHVFTGYGKVVSHRERRETKKGALCWFDLLIVTATLSVNVLFTVGSPLEHLFVCVLWIFRKQWQG